MENIENAVVELFEEDPMEETSTEFETVPEPKVKPGRPKKVKVNRAPEDCYMTTPKKMTEKEKNDVILFFQNELNTYQNAYEGLQRNTEGAFEKARNFETAYANLNREAQAKIGILKQNISLMYQNSLLVDLEK